MTAAKSAGEKVRGLWARGEGSGEGEGGGESGGTRSLARAW